MSASGGSLRLAMELIIILAVVAVLTIRAMSEWKATETARRPGS